MNPPKVYIAGPFFNGAQLAIIQQIEEVLMDRQYPFFSPRLQPANVGPGQITPELADKILRTNIENIDDCDVLLAVLDWTMPEHQHLYILGHPMTSGYTYDYASQAAGGPLDTSAVRGKHIAGPLNIPDSGTVFEMGYAFAKLGHGSFQIFGVTARGPSQKLNVMLARACHGIVQLDRLRDFFQPEGLNYDAAPAWAGKLQ